MENFNAAVRAVMMLDGKLYSAIRAAYGREQFPENGDDVDRHAFGMIAAVNAVYNFGYAAGFEAGARHMRDGSPVIIEKRAEKAKGE